MIDLFCTVASVNELQDKLKRKFAISQDQKLRQSRYDKRKHL